MSMLALHTRYQLLEQVRIPMAMVGNIAFPALSYLFFIVPQSALRDEPGAATAAAGQLALVSVLSVCLFSFGLGTAEERSTPWDPYLRTLSAGVVPRLGAKVITGLLFAGVGVGVVALIAVLLTSATATPVQAVTALLAMVVAGTPFLLMGISLGYLLPVKAALPAVQMIFLPMAFGGGLFLPPELFPRWLDAVSQLLSSRGGRDLVVAQLTSSPVPTAAWVNVVVWTVLMAGLAAWAYRRDEGRRFR
jgi:ABC-2 type transport system permease protein